MSPIYWKPKYGTRSSRHRAWVKQQARREATQGQRRSQPLLSRLTTWFRRRS